jgi:hypothetical protein
MVSDRFKAGRPQILVSAPNPYHYSGIEVSTMATKCTMCMQHICFHISTSDQISRPQAVVINSRITSPVLTTLTLAPWYDGNFSDILVEQCSLNIIQQANFISQYMWPWNLKRN